MLAMGRRRPETPRSRERTAGAAIATTAMPITGGLSTVSCATATGGPSGSRRGSFPVLVDRCREALGIRDMRWVKVAPLVVDIDGGAE